jgi:LPS export ABC transporter protein LptC
MMCARGGGCCSPARRLLGIALALSLAAAVAGCRETAAPIVASELEDLPGDRVLGLVHYMTTDGVRRGVLEADTAYRTRDSNSFDMRRVQLRFYTEQGAPNGELTSLTGEYDPITGAMTARGDVVLITVEANRRIETPELHYDPRTDRIWSDSATVMHEGGTRIQGTGFTADGRMQNVRVQNPRGRVEGLRIQF